MKVGKHTAFLIHFISRFADGDLSRSDFELDYSGYVIEHFPGMERENARLAQRFSQIIDVNYEYAVNRNLSDDDFKKRMKNALLDTLGSDDIYF